MESLWVAKTGLEAQQTRMSVVSQNLANVNTTGYKRGRAMFEDLLYQTLVQPGGLTSQQSEAPTGLNLGTGVRIVATDKQFEQGNLLNTGNALDLAVSGHGFFEILLPDGRQATRATARSRPTRTVSSRPRPATPCSPR
jgi:flagellar basal-body rod protein FlgG